MSDDETELKKRKDQLEAELSLKVKERRKFIKLHNKQGDLAGSAYAMKISSEFIAAIAVGAVIGLFIDRVAGTKPWGLIILLFVGFAAGIINITRSAGFKTTKYNKASLISPVFNDDKKED
jgi:ATP synthase protein I